MNISILTVQGFNIGSYLQAYALKSFLEEHGHTVSMIPTFHLAVTAGFSSPCITFDTQKILKLVSLWWYERKQKHPEPPDALVIGSDIVLQKKFIQHFARMNNYSFKKKILYAPCCGETQYSEYSQNEILWLRTMTAVSARDWNTATIVNKICNTYVPFVVDPCFLIDWSDVFSTPPQVPKDDTPYIIVYSYRGDKHTRSAAFRLKEETGCKLVSVGNCLNWCDTSVRVRHPLDIFAYIQNAESVITDTFHGTVLSMICNAPVEVHPQNHKTRFLIDSAGIPQKKMFTDHSSYKPKLDTMVYYSKKFLVESLII